MDASTLEVLVALRKKQRDGTITGPESVILTQLEVRAAQDRALMGGPAGARFITWASKSGEWYQDRIDRNDALFAETLQGSLEIAKELAAVPGAAVTEAGRVVETSAKKAAEEAGSAAWKAAFALPVGLAVGAIVLGGTGVAALGALYLYYGGAATQAVKRAG